MAYFGASSSAAGDPGLFSTLGRLGKLGLRNLPVFGPGIRALDFFQRPRGTGRAPQIPRILDQTQGPRRMPTGITVQADGTVRRKRRRMNAGNAKALKRAVRRTDAFVKLSKDALKNTGWAVVSKSSLAKTRATSRGAGGRGHPHHHR